MNTEDLVYRLRKRAEIRRNIPTRKSVQENQPDKIADLLDEAATMLRDQHLRIQQIERTQEYLFKKHDADKAEIEALKKEAALQRLSDFTQEAECKQAALTQTEIMTALTLGTPLYTHPADLTDEEIIEIWKEFDNKDVDDYFIAIAREILRKAQEK